MIESIGGPYYRPQLEELLCTKPNSRATPKTTGIVYAVILVVLLLLNFWAFPP